MFYHNNLQLNKELFQTTAIMMLLARFIKISVVVINKKIQYNNYMVFYQCLFKIIMKLSV